MYEQKKLIVFDIDGTLAPSKEAMDDEMATLFVDLLEHKQVAVISGGSYERFRLQFVDHLSCDASLLRNLSLFPTCSTSMYVFKGSDWEPVYEDTLSDSQRDRIMKAFDVAFKEGSYTDPEKVWGEIVEDRGTQITFSGLGQQAPIEAKEAWDPDHIKRLALKEILDQELNGEFEVRVAGTTSIDVTPRGIDKGSGINKMEAILNIPKNEMLFIGDALFEGGNDYPVKEAGVECIAVTGPEQTKEVIRTILRT